MKEIDVVFAEGHLKWVLAQVEESDEGIMIKRDGAENFVVMSESHFNGLMETLHLLSSPANAKHLQHAITQYETGDLISISLSEF